MDRLCGRAAGAQGDGLPGSVRPRVDDPSLGEEIDAYAVADHMRGGAVLLNADHPVVGGPSLTLLLDHPFAEAAGSPRWDPDARAYRFDVATDAAGFSLGDVLGLATRVYAAIYEAEDGGVPGPLEGPFGVRGAALEDLVVEEVRFDPRTGVVRLRFAS